MSGERVLHVAVKGFRPQLIDIAADPNNPKSKRCGIIDQEDQSLNKNLGELEEGTKSRNRAFQQRLDEIWSLTDAWEAKLRTEAREATETIMNQRDEYQRHLDNFSIQLQTELTSAFDQIDTLLLPKQFERTEQVSEELNHFVTHVAPAEIDKTSGVVSRQLKKMYENFYIGQQKEHIREQKFVKQANKHKQMTAQRFTDEKALTSACFHTLYDDVVEEERRAARMHLYRWDNCVEGIVALREELAKETDTRNDEDVVVLDTIADTQQLLQQTILEHFGREDEESGGGGGGGGGDPMAFPVTSKLNNRMASIVSRRRSNEAAAAASSHAGVFTDSNIAAAAPDAE